MQTPCHDFIKDYIGVDALRAGKNHDFFYLNQIY